MAISSRARRTILTGSALLALPLGVTQAALSGAAPAGAAESAPHLAWSTVVNNGDQAPGSAKLFNSYSQPSVNRAGVVTFRGRTRGGSEPARGVYQRDLQAADSMVTPVAATGDLVPAPNNSAGTFNEFPSFPRIGAANDVIATRGQSTPVWTYTVDGTDTKVGTSGIYATAGGNLSTATSLLGAVPGYEFYSVPGAAPGTRFDQFPGSPAVDGSTVVFKGNYTDEGVGKTGVFYRRLDPPGEPVELIANSATLIPNQPADGTVTFGSTAPPSAADGRTVFTGWDNEDNPTAGGIYLADITPSPVLHTLVGIGDPVPGSEPAATFTNFGEGLSFDGRYVGFWASWGTETRSITLTCPTDGNADLLAYCAQTYPNGYTTQVPVQQGIFVYDTETGQLHPVAATGARFDDFQYWVFSGRPPGTGGGDEQTLEPPRWRVSAFAAVAGQREGYQVAFKASPVTGGSGIYLAQAGRTEDQIVTAVETSMPATSVDAAAPAGAVVTSVGLERDGFRGHWLALTASMLDPQTSAGWAGVYLSRIPDDINAQTITVTSPPPDRPLVGDSYTLKAVASSGLPVAFALDPSTTEGACAIDGATVRFLHAGTCTIDIDQGGDATWTAAPRVQQRFVIERVRSRVSLAIDPSGVTYGQPSRVTATVDVERGTVAGNVQFTVDGAPLADPVRVVDSSAVRAELVGPSGAPLDAGVHHVGATFSPIDAVTYAPASSLVSHVVSQAATRLRLTVQPRTVTAHVRAVAPGSGTPTGRVSFAVNGKPIGTATLRSGVAVLMHAVRPGLTKHVSAAYTGDANFTGSSASTTRRDPTLRAQITSAHPMSAYGWYRTPVTISFQCTTHGSSLIGGCPSPVHLRRNGAAQAVTRTVTAADGGAATVAVRGINIDRRVPRVHVVGIRNGAVYAGDVPRAICVGHDRLSGIARCDLLRHTDGQRTVYRAVAVDRASNRSTVRGWYRALAIYLEPAQYRDGVFRVHIGATYVLVAHSDRRPVYYDAETAPGRPRVRDRVFYPAGPQRWVLGVTMTPSLSTHRLWNLGVKIHGTMHVVRIRVT